MARLPIEIAFLSPWISNPHCLTVAARIAAETQACVVRTLIAEGFVSEALYYRALARHLGVVYVDGWPALAEPEDAADEVLSGAVRLAPSGSWLLAPDGQALHLLLRTRAAGHSLTNIAITSPSHLRALVVARAGAAIEHRASNALPAGRPKLSAKTAAGRKAGLAATAVLVVAIVGLFWLPRLAGDLFGALFLASMLLRVFVCLNGFHRPMLAPPLADAKLPVYTVLVALRHETDIVSDLIAALKKLDYPRAKLDVVFLVEPEDYETRAALAAPELPPWCSVIVGPTSHGALRTKPRALNIGLHFARGSLVTVYDAEDQPEPSQLRRAAARLVADTDVACLQASLAISNSRSGWLSRLFAIEYAGLFDLFNIGVSALGLPMALGGTSNHFKIAALKAVGGWDAWNVTEDADLGLRLARFGYTVECLPSTTFEDAPERFGAWMKQRRRWTKGWMQTLLVLARDLPTASSQLGASRTVVLTLLLTNLVTGPLLWPVFSVAVVFRWGRLGLPDPQGLTQVGEATIAAVVILIGFASTLWQGWAGSRQRGLRISLVELGSLFPYQLMISAAAWGGLWDLVRRPFYWHKTVHGRASRKPISAFRAGTEFSAMRRRREARSRP